MGLQIVLICGGIREVERYGLLQKGSFGDIRAIIDIHRIFTIGTM